MLCLIVIYNNNKMIQEFNFDNINQHRIEMYENIYDYEQIYGHDEENEDYYINENYYIGLFFYDDLYDNLLLAATVNSKTFFKYDFKYIVDYLNNHSIIHKRHYIQPEIMKLIITEDIMFNVILKTFWLRLVQRTWKKVLRQRKELFKKTPLVQYLHNRQIGLQQSKIPQLRGMLCYLKNNN